MKRAISVKYAPHGVRGARWIVTSYDHQMLVVFRDYSLDFDIDARRAAEQFIIERGLRWELDQGAVMPDGNYVFLLA